MGQYYNIITFDNTKDNEYRVYDRHTQLTVDSKLEYTPAKLTEHSWIGNEMINSFSNIIYEKPVCIAWIGDYADDLKNYDITNNALDKSKVKILHKIAWDTDKYLPLLVKDFATEKMLLVNWDKKEFINMQEYINQNTQNGWCLHPLPLLTALGNGLGGGDYYGKNQDKIGIWAFDKISFENQESEKFLLENNFIKKYFEFSEE